MEVVIPAFVKKVDKDLAQQVVALMVQIRNEVLGERPAYESPRKWRKVAECTLDLDG